MYLQKVFGPKCIIPAFLRKRAYNYYVDLNVKDCLKFNVNLPFTQNECIICLEPFFKTKLTIKNESTLNTEDKPVDQTNRIEITPQQVASSLNLFQKLKEKFNSFLLSFKNTNSRKNHMLTPCNHLFHSACLEAWMNKKQQCPFCRNSIPFLE